MLKIETMAEMKPKELALLKPEDFLPKSPDLDQPWTREGWSVHKGDPYLVIHIGRDEGGADYRWIEIHDTNPHRAEANVALVVAVPALVNAMSALLPLARAYLKGAPSHPDNAKVADAEDVLRSAGVQIP